jgi:pyrroline-5-carboxylate reductase
VGTVVTVPDALIDAAAACAGVGPAYWALLVEAQVDAAVKRGMPAAMATDLILSTMAGAAELIGAREGDTLQVRREVASPGGTTARGLAALERGGIRTAFISAMDDVVGG